GRYVRRRRRRRGPGARLGRDARARGGAAGPARAACRRDRALPAGRAPGAVRRARRRLPRSSARLSVPRARPTSQPREENAMFGLGTQELLVILVIDLVLILLGGCLDVIKVESKWTRFDM